MCRVFLVKFLGWVSIGTDDWLRPPTASYCGLLLCFIDLSTLVFLDNRRSLDY